MPTELTVPAHGVPNNWPAWLEMTGGCPVVHRPRSGPPFYTDVVDANTLSFPGVNSAGTPAGAVAGMLIYQPPRDLSTVITIYIELFDTSTGEQIGTFENVMVTGPGTVELLLTSAETEALAWTRARFRLVFTEANGDDVVQLLGDFNVTRRL